MMKELDVHIGGKFVWFSDEKAEFQKIREPSHMIWWKKCNAITCNNNFSHLCYRQIRFFTIENNIGGLLVVFILNNDFPKWIFIWVMQIDFDTVTIKIIHPPALAKNCK